MFCLNLNTTNPFFNLAVDEYLLKNSGDEFLILGINTPSVIIGKHQVAHREADTRFVYENGIPVIRRISGGGTVYHDEGNLNFTFILNSTKGRQVDFRKYTLPVVEFLRKKGINAYFGGRNDLLVEGFKISGNAEHVYRERILHHGTLLFNANLHNLRSSLRKKISAYTTRAVASVPSRVINLAEIIRGSRSMEDFRLDMLNYFLDIQGNSIYELTETDIEEISALEKSKYRTWEWNYAYGPEYSFLNRYEIDNIKHCCSLSVKDGIVVESKFQGSWEMILLSQKINGCRHMVEDISQILHEEKINMPDSAVFNFF